MNLRDSYRGRVAPLELPIAGRLTLGVVDASQPGVAGGISRLLFRSIDDARSFCRDFFTWYNHHHRHAGIGLMTPTAVHHGHAATLHAERQRVLAAAYAARPERFVRRAPTPPPLPTAAWINKPDPEPATH